MIFQALILMINKQISMATNILLFQYLKVRNEMKFICVFKKMTQALKLFSFIVYERSICDRHIVTIPFILYIHDMHGFHEYEISYCLKIQFNIIQIFFQK